MPAWFRHLATVEALSYLLLLGVAVPLKHLAGWPLGVQVVGMAHGWLWLAYVAAAVGLRFAGALTTAGMAWALLASVLPGGPWWLHHRIAGSGRRTEGDPVAQDPAPPARSASGCTAASRSSARRR